MPLIPFFLPAQVSDPEAILDRFSGFMKAQPSYSADFDITANDAPLVSGTIYLVRPDKIKVSYHNQKLDYTFTLNKNEILEKELKEELYQEGNVYGRVTFLMSSDISPYNDSVPIGPLVQGSLKVKSKWSVLGKKEGMDWLHTQYTSDGVDYITEVLVDSQGQLRAFDRRLESQGKVVGKSHVSLKAAGTVPASEPFDVLPPSGLTSYSRKPYIDPLQPDEKLENAQLVRDGRKSDVKSALGGRAVLALLDPEWASTDFGKETLAKVTKIFDKAKLKMVLVNGTPGATPAGWYEDREGKVLTMLSATTLPIFFVLDANLAVEQAFLGVSPREQESFLDDVRYHLFQKRSKGVVVDTKTGAIKKKL